MRRRTDRPVPDELTARIAEALDRVELARGLLADATGTGAPLTVRRSAHAGLRRAYDDADVLLRQAVRAAKQHSYPEWSRWRTRLSRLDTARQLHLFAENDDPGVLGLGTIRALDTGMSGPPIGDLLHGQSQQADAPARYGLDVEALLIEPAERKASVMTMPGGRVEDRRIDTTVVPLAVGAAATPLEAA